MLGFENGFFENEQYQSNPYSRLVELASSNTVLEE